jgi:hypothetical protein
LEVGAGTVKVAVEPVSDNADQDPPFTCEATTTGAAPVTVRITWVGGVVVRLLVEPLLLPPQATRGTMAHMNSNEGVKRNFQQTVLGMPTICPFGYLAFLKLDWKSNPERYKTRYQN